MLKQSQAFCLTPDPVSDLKILDVSAGKRAVWFNKKHPNAVYLDIRPEVDPDIVADSRELPFENESFDLIVFDPPHLNCGKNSIMGKRYGSWTQSHITDTIIRTGEETARVGKKNCILIFKWNDHDIPVMRILPLLNKWEPLFGHLTKDGPGSKTYFVTLRKK